MPKPPRDPWVAVDATIRKNAKVAVLPSDSARWGWIVVLGEAKLQRPTAGCFRNQANFVESVGRFAKFGQSYIDTGLLEPSSDLCPRCRVIWHDLPPGAYVVHDWQQHQRDPLAAERADNWRNEHGLNGDRTPSNDDQSSLSRAGATTTTVTTTGTTTDTKEEGRADKPRPPSERQKALTWLREHEVAQPVGWENAKLNELVKVNGSVAVIGAFEEARQLGTALTVRNFIRWAEQSLNPDPAVPRPVPTGIDPAEEARRAFDRGVERTQREMARMRGEASA